MFHCRLLGGDCIFKNLDKTADSAQLPPANVSQMSIGFLKSQPRQCLCSILLSGHELGETASRQCWLQSRGRLCRPVM